MTEGRITEDLLGKAREHAWSYFTIHAEQRMKSVNFYLIALAFLIAGAVTALKDQWYIPCAAISTFGAFVTFLFWKMDGRNRQLVKLAEAALKPIERDLAERTGIPSVKILHRADGNKGNEWTYTEVFKYLYLSAGLLFLGLLTHSLWVAYKPPTDLFVFKVAVHSILSVALCWMGSELLSRQQRMWEKGNKIRANWLFGLGMLVFAMGILLILFLLLVLVWK